MRKLKLLLVLLYALLTWQTAWAKTVVIDGIKYSLDTDAKTASVAFDGESWYSDGIGTTYLSSYTGDIVVPASVNYHGVAYEVVEIEGHAFDSSNITSVSVPESVSSFGTHCFSGCSSLTSINIPKSITSLGDCCFMLCSSLTGLSIPESVTSLGEQCFDRCSSLTSISIPEGVTSLGYMCFSDCTSLTSISFPEGMTSLGHQCFAGCTSLTSISLPGSVTSLGGVLLLGLH